MMKNQTKGKGWRLGAIVSRTDVAALFSLRQVTQRALKSHRQDIPDSFVHHT